jgi:hypothetical protein
MIQDMRVAVVSCVTVGRCVGCCVIYDGWRGFFTRADALLKIVGAHTADVPALYTTQHVLNWQD